MSDHSRGSHSDDPQDTEPCYCQEEIAAARARVAEGGKQAVRDQAFEEAALMAERYLDYVYNSAREIAEEIRKLKGPL